MSLWLKSHCACELYLRAMPRKRAPEGATQAVQQLAAQGLLVKRIRPVIGRIDGMDDESKSCLVDRPRSADFACPELLDEIKLTESLETADGTPWQLQMCCPHKLVNAVMGRNLAAMARFQRTWDRRPSDADDPWRVCYGFDECWSGSRLHESGPEIMVVSFTFLEYGRSEICSSSTWFTVAVIRAKKVGKLEGSFSAIARRILAIHFLSFDNGLALVGAVVHLPELAVC